MTATQPHQSAAPQKTIDVLYSHDTSASDSTATLAKENQQRQQQSPVAGKPHAAETQTERAALHAGCMFPTCARCGCTTANASAQCSFHPYLLMQPGPFLYSPEWHACKAAGHTANDSPCYTRPGHFFPDVPASVQNAARAQQAVADSAVPVPRTTFPVPMAAA